MSDSYTEWCREHSLRPKIREAAEKSLPLTESDAEEFDTWCRERGIKPPSVAAEKAEAALEGPLFETQPWAPEIRPFPHLAANTEPPAEEETFTPYLAAWCEVESALHDGHRVGFCTIEEAILLSGKLIAAAIRGDE